MPEIITDQVPLDHLFMGLYDSGEHEVDLSVTAERVVDISDICEETVIGMGQTIIKYGRSTKGLIAQIQDRYEDGEDTGSDWHIFPEELGVAGMVTADHFLHRARVLGCDPAELAEVIIEFIPSSET